MRVRAETLSRVVALESDDVVKRDLELTCTACGTVLCDIEHGDSLDVLIRTAAPHVAECRGQ